MHSEKHTCFEEYSAHFKKPKETDESMMYTARLDAFLEQMLEERAAKKQIKKLTDFKKSEKGSIYKFNSTVSRRIFSSPYHLSAEKSLENQNFQHNFKEFGEVKSYALEMHFDNNFNDSKSQTKVEIAKLNYPFENTSTEVPISKGKRNLETNDDKLVKQEDTENVHSFMYENSKTENIIKTIQGEVICGNSNNDKLAAGLETKPYCITEDGDTFDKHEKETSNFAPMNESRLSHRFRGDHVMNEGSIINSLPSNRLLSKKWNSNRSFSMSATSQLENFLCKYSRTGNPQKQPSQLQNETDDESDIIYSENTTNFSTTSISTLESISTSTSLSNIQCESFASSNHTRMKKKKYTQTSILNYFKINKSLQKRRARPLKKSGKRVFKARDKFSLSSASEEDPFGVERIGNRTSDNCFLILRNLFENNVPSKPLFLESSDFKRHAADSSEESFTKFDKILSKLNPYLCKNKCSIEMRDKEGNSSMTSKLHGFKLNSHPHIKTHPNSKQMKEKISSSFCNTFSFESSIAFNSNIRLGHNLEDNSQHESCDVITGHSNINIFKKPVQSTLDTPFHKRKYTNTLADDVLVESKSDLRDKKSGSNFWKSLTSDLVENATLSAAEHAIFRIPHVQDNYNIENKENLSVMSNHSLVGMPNTSVPNTRRMNGVVDEIHLDVQPETIRSLGNSVICVEDKTLMPLIINDKISIEDNSNNIRSNITESDCQSVFCCKHAIHSNSQNAPTFDKHMDIISSSGHSIPHLSNLNSYTNTSGCKTNSPLDNEMLMNLYRINEFNRRRETRYSKLSETFLPERLNESNIILENSYNRSSIKNDTAVDTGKNVNNIILNRKFSQNGTENKIITSAILAEKPANVKTLPANLNETVKNRHVTKGSQLSNLSISSKEVMGSEHGLRNFSRQQTLSQNQLSSEDIYCLFSSQDDLFTQSQGVLNNIENHTINPNGSEDTPTKNIACSRTSILYGDNLLKQLLDEKATIIKSYNEKKSKDNHLEKSDTILAKTYIKRYRKNKFRIFKIKRRFPTHYEGTYLPKEHKVMNSFINQVENNLQNEPLADNEDRQSVVTPSSYLTDETIPDDPYSDPEELTQYQKLLRDGINMLSTDKSLIFSKFSDTAPGEIDSSDVLTQIEEIIIKVLNHYENGRVPFLTIPLINPNCVFRNGRHQLVDLPKCGCLYWKDSPKKMRFNLILCILNKIRILLKTKTKLTKREIFYQLKGDLPFKFGQDATDRAITTISRMLRVGMWELNITAQKGLVYGNVKLVMDTGETINCNVAGTLVPKDVMNICEIQSQAYFILVVEKESIFNKLLEEDLPNKLTRPFILITGKGYPDLNTQLFLKKLWMVMAIPVFILADSDPDGIAIMLNYRFGSRVSAHISEYLAIPKAKWIGLFPTEIFDLHLSYEIMGDREMRKAERMLQLQCVQENRGIKRQLEKCLETACKASIEALIKSDSYLSNRYLPLKFWQNDLI